jgi:uncharacterized membrane protein
MAESSGFEFNRPTIVVLLYLASLITGIPILVGLILSYVWSGEAQGGWEASHFRWFIRTFWLSIAWAIIGAATFFFGIGMIILALGGVWIAVRSIKGLIAAQNRLPVTNVETWLW